MVRPSSTARYLLISGSAAALVLLTSVPTAQAEATLPTQVAIGTFTGTPTGTSVFSLDGSTITVTGHYAHLTPNHWFYTVIYSNGICDPAQAFPVGPFHAGPLGNAHLDVTVPATVPVDGTMSVSVRMADTWRDLDHDGKKGKSDVVAVPGQPAIGLVQCDYHPQVIG